MPTLYDRNALALRAIAQETNQPCVHCGLEIDWSAPRRSRWQFSADHITPSSLGGLDDLWNLQTSHIGCNSRRGNGVTRGLGSHNGKRPADRPERNAQSERWP